MKINIAAEMKSLLGSLKKLLLIVHHDQVKYFNPFPHSPLANIATAG